MNILIFGLPGSGKSTFAKKLIGDKKIAYLMQMKLERCLMIGTLLKQVESGKHKE